MGKKFIKLLLFFAVAVALMGVPFAASVALGQQKNPASKPDQYPRFFKVYSKDGRESLTATCIPIQSHPIVDQVTCKFVHVRFQLPASDVTNIPLSVEEALKKMGGRP